MPLPESRLERFRRLELIAYLHRYGVLSTIFLADLGLLLLSVFLFFMASDYPLMARRFPRLVLVMIVVVTLLDMIKILRGAPQNTCAAEDNNDSQGIGTRQQLKVFYMSILIFIFFLFMLFFGLALGTLFFILFSGWTLGFRNLKTLIFSSVIITAFVYVIFEVIMQSFLPEGLIFTIMGG
jgi:hypothetical protein